MLGASQGDQHTDEIDLLSVAQRLQESGMSVKQTQRCWELFRKRLRDVQKRESEFVTVTRQNISADLCPGQCEALKERVNIYDAQIKSNLMGQSALKTGGALEKLVGSEANLTQVLNEFDQIITGR